MIADGTVDDIRIEKRKRCIPRAELYASVDEFIIQGSVHSTEVELQNLCYGPEDDEGAKRLVWAFKWITAEIRAGLNWDMINAVLSRLMVLHKDTIENRPEVNKALADVQKAHAPEHDFLEEQFNRVQVLCDLVLGVQF